MSTIRQARVAEMIKRELSEILVRETRDPRLALVSVTSAEVTRDFTYAKVYISSLGNDEEKAAALKALQNAAGYLRGQLGKVLELRSVPALAFRYDQGIERGARMFELLRSEERTFATTDDRPDPSLLPEMTEEDFALPESAASEHVGVEP
jgi:ribosome-binding factor A